VSDEFQSDNQTHGGRETGGGRGVRLPSGGKRNEEYVGVLPRKDTREKGSRSLHQGSSVAETRADNCRAERLVGHSEACHFPVGLRSLEGEVTLYVERQCVQRSSNLRQSLAWRR
jgi:hypothetical protein